MDRQVGFRFSIDLAIDSESHDPTIDLNNDGVLDAAGFSIAIISSDLRGIGISFWADRIWASKDDSANADDLFSQAEGIAQAPSSMATLRRYDLEVRGNAYRLKVDGTAILSGPLRDYSNFVGTPIEGIGVLNNFDKPNSITIGDALASAQSIARIGEITTETPYTPEPGKSVTLDLSTSAQLTWDSLPGTTYSIQSASNPGSFSELDQFTATGFTSSFIDLRPLFPRQFYKLVTLP